MSACNVNKHNYIREREFMYSRHQNLWQKSVLELLVYFALLGLHDKVIKAYAYLIKNSLRSKQYRQTFLFKYRKRVILNASLRK